MARPFHLYQQATAEGARPGQRERSRWCGIIITIITIISRCGEPIGSHCEQDQRGLASYGSYYWY